MLIEEMANRFRRRLALREPHIGKRSERPADIIARRQQRLRGIGGRAGHDADGAASPALIEKLHGAGGALAANLHAGDIVADLDRKIELRLGLLVGRLENKRRFAERQALKIERAHTAGLGRAGGGAQHFDAQRAGRVVGSGERPRAGDAAGDDRHRSRVEHRRQAFGEIRTTAEIDGVGQPDQLDLACGGEEARDGGQRLGAVDGVRLRLDQLQPHARRAGRRERNVARAFGERNERHRAMIAFRARYDVFGGAQARVPGGGRGPAVVDEDRDRRARRHRRQRRVPQRARGGEDDESGEKKPHDGEPPRRPCRRFFARRDFKQQPGRREIDAARAWRDQPQQPPQHRQGQKPDQHQRFGKAERQSANHAGTLGRALAGMRGPLSTRPPPMRACSASSSSLAGRSVRWMVKLQDSRSVSARISARWRRTRAS